MENNRDLELKKLFWKDVRSDISNVNPKLAEIINEFNPGKDYFFIKANYPYKSQVLKKGVIHLPTPEGKTLPINHASFSEEVRNNLSYSSVPLGIILKNGSEVYYEKDFQVTSLAFFEPGIILGLWEALEPSVSHFPRKIWHISSGARSLFMLPKIGDAIAHERLKKKYNVRSPLPKSLFDHSNIFAEIVNSKTVLSNWRNEILYFSKKWLEESQEPGWIKFKAYLLEEAWKLSSYNRNEITRNIVWGLFTNYLAKRGLKIKPYFIHILRHILASSLGAIPAYKPARKNNFAGPIEDIQEAYLTTYDVNYLPTIMQPYHFNIAEKPNAVYCSLQLPVMFYMSLKSSDKTTLLNDLRIIKSIWEYFIEAALDGELFIEGTPIESVVNNIKLEFFHSERDAYGEIDLSSNIPLNDKDMLSISSHKKQLNFSSACKFFRGCIRISSII